MNAIEVGQAIINAANANDDTNSDADGDSAGAGSAAGGGTDPGCDQNDPECGEDDGPLEERLRNKSYDEAEEYLDRELRDRQGWTKRPLNSKNPDQGVRYYDGRGNSVQVNRGYSDGNYTGSSVKSGPYAKVSGGSAGVKRFPLQ